MIKISNSEKPKSLLDPPVCKDVAWLNAFWIPYSIIMQPVISCEHLDASIRTALSLNVPHLWTGDYAPDDTTAIHNTYKYWPPDSPFTIWTQHTQRWDSKILSSTHDQIHLMVNILFVYMSACSSFQLTWILAAERWWIWWCWRW